MEPGAVDQHGDFDTGAFGQVGDEVRVLDVAVELELFATLKGVDNVSCIFFAALPVFCGERAGKFFLYLVFLGGFIVLVFLQDVSILAGIPAGAMRAVFFDQIGAFAEPGIVFRVVTAGLGNVIIQG